jgi:prepilin-type N-terminal cleavage/methylation domain-containing protein
MTKQNASGFTLIELVIAISILVFMSLFTSNMIQRATKDRAKIQTSLATNVLLRDTLQFMANDIKQAFNYSDFNIQLFNEAQKIRKENAKKKKRKKKADPNAANPPPPDPAAAPDNAATNEEDFKEKKEKKFTFFNGEKDKLNFTSLSFSRTQQDQRVSDQAEIGYFLQNCGRKMAEKSTTSSLCLWRRVAPFIDAKYTEGGDSTPLIPNVKSLKFRYLIKNSAEWLERWNTQGEYEVRMLDDFPLAVEITLTLEDKSVTPPREVSMTTVASLRFPNNKENVDAAAGVSP